MSDTEVLVHPTPADVSATGAPTPEAATAPPAVAEPPPAATRRAVSETPVLVPFDSALPGVSSADIRAELARRGKRVPKLMAEREAIIQQMEAIEDALARIGEDLPSAGPAPRARRARSGSSLRDAVAAAVQPGETVAPAEVVERVRASGYASTAANLGQMVATTLAKDARFVRVGRGQYRRAVS